MTRARMRCGLALAATLATALATPAFAQSGDGVFKGKQMTLIIASAPGGGYDLQGRLLARHMGRHLPGNPNIVVQNMPGATGIQAADFIYSSAPKDGTVFALLHREVVSAKLTDPTTVRFDAEKFNWIGNIDAETGVSVSWHTSPIATTDDLFRKEMIVGGTGAVNDDEILPRLLNVLIGTKFKVVSGYKGVAEVTLAMQRGEVMGTGDWSWSSVRAGYADMVADKRMHILLVQTPQRIAEIPDVPTSIEFAKNDEDRALLKIFMEKTALARPLAAPPGLVEDRVKLLRTAFMETTRDPEFRKDAQQAKLNPASISGEDVERLVVQMARTPQSVIDRIMAATAPPK